MARYSILSKPVSFTLPYLAALLTSAQTAPAQTAPEPTLPPLVVPYRPLLAATDGWQQEGELVGQSISAAGPDSWLAVHWYFADADQRNTRQLTTQVRLMRRGSPYSDPFFLPEEPDFSSGYKYAIQTLAGSQGAWVLWHTPAGIKAWWISAVTGRPAGQPILLPGGSGSFGFDVNGDGETGWITSRSYAGFHVSTVTASGGIPRVLGSNSLPFPEFLSNPLMSAAHQGKFLQLRSSPDTPTVISAVTINADATFSTPQPWPSGSWQAGASSYGLMKYGSGWMAVYDTLVTPLLAGRIVMGQELLPDGMPVSTPAQALFVAPNLPGSPRLVISTNTKGIILTASDTSGGNYSGFGMILEKGAPTRLLYIGPLSPSRINTSGLLAIPIAAALREDQLALLRPDEEDDDGFVQKLSFYHTGATPGPIQDSVLSVAPAIGIQEEPALAWQADVPIITWQQISTRNEGPTIRQRRYPERPAQSRDVILDNTAGFPLSSPDVAVNGLRILLVGRQSAPDFAVNPNDPDDVAGVLMENNQVVSSYFKIGYGPGSQRAACVVPYLEGFCVVWREELNQNAAEYTSRIRMAILDRNGFSNPPGGHTIVSSSLELSSPCIAVNGNRILVVWKQQYATGTRVEAAMSFGLPGNAYPVDVFPGNYTTSPDVVATGDGFLITARCETNAEPNAILAAYYSGGTVNTVPLLPPTAGMVQGREPASASLADNNTALFWLNHRKSNRPSNQVWMAVFNAARGQYGPPIPILSGLFDRDTLTVKGDGSGRVLLGVKSIDPQQLGVRVFLLAPGVSEAPRLTLISSGSPGSSELRLRWTPNLLFPAASDIVESSRDLSHWTFAGSQVTYTPSPDGYYFRIPLDIPGPYYFRLRADGTGP